MKPIHFPSVGYKIILFHDCLIQLTDILKTCKPAIIIFSQNRMATHLASIYGTEKDKVNCSFYFKIGACRHGEKCSRKHVKPNFSQTLLMPNFYQNPANLIGCRLNAVELQQDFDLFYEDIFLELAKYGEIEELNVCDNVGDHLVGSIRY